MKVDWKSVLARFRSEARWPPLPERLLSFLAGLSKLSYTNLYVCVRMWVCDYYACAHISTCVYKCPRICTFTFACVCISTCVYTCVHVYVRICKCMCAFVHVCTHVYVFYACVHRCTHVYVHLHVWTCMCTSVCVCTRMYVHVRMCT